MPPKSAIEIFQEISDLEEEISQEDHVSVEDAKKFYNSLIDINLDFIESQKYCVTQLNNDDFNDDDQQIKNLQKLQIYDSVQQKIIHLNRTLKEIIESNVSPATSFESVNQDDQAGLPSAIRKFTTCSSKQKLLINLTELLKPTGDIDAIEAQIRYDHLTLVYKHLTSDQVEMAKKNDTKFKNQLEISTHILLEVIRLQATLADYMPSKEIKSNGEFQIKPSNRFDDPSPYYKKQKEMMQKIKKFKLIDFSSRTRSELQMYNEMFPYIRQMFISNQNEIEMRIDGYSLQYQRELVQDFMVEMDAIQAGIEKSLSSTLPNFTVCILKKEFIFCAGMLLVFYLTKCRLLV